MKGIKTTMGMEEITTTLNIKAMRTTYYAIFASAKGSKDLVRIVESFEYASYLTAKYHEDCQSVNYKAWQSDENGFISTTEKEPIFINGRYNKKGAQ